MPRNMKSFKTDFHEFYFSELYLEEILDRIIEVDVECQTDAFIKRLPSPVFIPQKTGVDVATQIEDGEVPTIFQYYSR